MIPVRDNVPARSFPFVNYGMIVVTALVFFAQLTEEPGEPSLIEQYGMIPARVVQPDRPVEIPDISRVRLPDGRIELRKEMRPAAEPAVPPWLTLLTCIFLHGGWLHFLGNMWFLYIFGDNVEDRFGHFGHLLFYVGCGVAASAAHFLTDPGSTVPTIGASGAIAGVMGAYFLLYPRARILTIVPIFIFLHFITLPAYIFLGIWFAIQLLQGTLAAGATGVAWWAHIGGFVVGVGVAWLLRSSHKLAPGNEPQ